MISQVNGKFAARAVFLVLGFCLLVFGQSTSGFAETDDDDGDKPQKDLENILNGNERPESYQRNGQPVRKMVKRLNPSQDSHTSSPFFKASRADMLHNEETALELGVMSKGQELDLSLQGLALQVMPEPPNDKAQEAAEEMIAKSLNSPSYDMEAIMDRQEFYKEVTENPELIERLYKIYNSSAEFKWVTKYQGQSTESAKKLNNLHKSQALATMTSHIEKLGEIAKSGPLARLKEFSSSITDNPRFQRFLKYQNQVSTEYNLNDAIFTITEVLYSRESAKALKDISVRHQFNKAYAQILESADVLIRTDALQGTTPRESEEVGRIKMVQQLSNVIEAMRSQGLEKMSELPKEEFYSIVEKHREEWLAPVEYFLETLHEFRNAHVPKEVELRNLPEEISYVASTATIQEIWKSRGADVKAATLRTDRQTNLEQGYNFIELHKTPAQRLMANDIISNPKENVLLLTGPNSGGKTTYLRMVGQMSWLAQLGWMVPVNGKAKENVKIEVQLHDKVLTALEVSDAPEKDQSRLVAELDRAKNLAYSDDFRVTPNSLVLFDEFANGTNAEESLEFNNELVEYLSEMNSTNYFSTHKHELAEMNGDEADMNGDKKEKLLGTHPIGIEIVEKDGKQVATYRVLRNTVSPSLGRNVADAKGLTKDGYRNQVKHGSIQGAYDLKDTRYFEYKELRKKRPSKDGNGTGSGRSSKKPGKR